MKTDHLLQYLRDCTLEEGRAYIQEHISELSDFAAIGIALRDEARRQRRIHLFTSLKLSELLIFFGGLVSHVPSQALGLATKGDALSSMGHEQAALDCYDAAGSKFLDENDEIGWASTRVGWMISCAWLGRVEDALQGADRAREVFLRHGERYLDLLCHVDYNRAVISTQIGQYQRALQIYEQNLAILSTMTDRSEDWIKREIAMIEYNQARNLLWLGDFDQAYRLFQKARASFLILGQTGSVVRAEMNLANLDYIQGYYGSALRRYYQIRDSIIAHNIGNTSMSPIMLHIASCLIKLNRAEEACRLAAEAVDNYRQMGKSLDTGDALREYATTLIAAGRLKDAFTVLEEAWVLFDQGGFMHHATVTKLQQAELLLDMGSIDAAYDQACQLKEYFDKQGLISHATHACLVMASTLVERAQRQVGQQTAYLREATALCEEVVALAGQHNLQEQSYKSLYLLGQIAMLQKNLEEAEKHYSAAIEQIESILDDLVSDLRPAFLHTTWIVYEDMMALCLQREQIERAFSYLERARSLALRQYLNRPKKLQDEASEQDLLSPALQAKNAAILRIQNELGEWQEKYHRYSAQLAGLDGVVSPSIDREIAKAELKRAEANISELFERLQLSQIDDDSLSHLKKRMISEKDHSIKGIDVAQLCQRLLPDQLLLAYFLYKGRLVIFALTADKIIIRENPDGVALLKRLLPPLHARLEPGGWPDPQKPPQQAVRRLLQKLYDVLVAPVASLLPSSSGALTIVPYGLLHNLPFHALHDGSHFLVENFQINYLPASSLLAHPNAQMQVRYNQPPLVFGYSGNGDLPRALNEAKVLSSMLSGRCYLESEATIARLMELASGSPIVHIATHGKSRLDAPNFSYVRLADGQLNAIDAFSLNLEGCELVTLSGCETGLALSGGGDEQLGLGRAFLASGAASLVISLWPVEDSATSELMKRFYQRLLSGDTKVQALRAAQCSFLEHSSDLYTHPYFWAAFRLVGEVGHLQSVGAIKS